MLAFFMPIFAGAVRHTFTALAGILVAKGYLGADQVAGFVGSSMFFVGLGWSIWQKLNQPEVLAHVAARVQARQVAAKRAWVGDALAGPTAAAVLAMGVMGTALGTGPASAQGWFFSQPPAKVYYRPVHKVKHAKPVPAPTMKAGLTSLLPQVSIAPPPALQPQPSLLEKLQTVTVTDLQMAIAKAQAIAAQQPPTAASTSANVRAQCYSAILTVINPPPPPVATTAPLTAPVPLSQLAQPSPAASLFTNFEVAAELQDAIGPMAPVQTACAPVAQALRINTLQLVTGILGGAAGLAKLGVAIP